MLIFYKLFEYFPLVIHQNNCYEIKNLPVNAASVQLAHAICFCTTNAHD